MRQRPRGDSRGILDPGRPAARGPLPSPPAGGVAAPVGRALLVDRLGVERAVRAAGRAAPGGQRGVPAGRRRARVRRGGRGGPRPVPDHAQRHRPVRGVQFRPGGFRPVLAAPVSRADRPSGAAAAGRPIHPDVPVGAGTFPGAPTSAASDDERCRALDTLLTAWQPEPDPMAEEAVRLAEAIRTDRTVLRVDDFAARHDVPVRRLQRLFLDYVGVGPKWVIRRYRLQEAVEQAAGGPLTGPTSPPTSATATRPTWFATSPPWPGCPPPRTPAR